MARGRYMMTIAYDGGGFHGWQEQLPPEGDPPRTVQGVVREAMQRVLGEPIRVQGASRTDTGVHALGQVAHFDCELRVPLDRAAAAINSRLPDDVEVLSVRPVRDDFDATSDAVEKQYRYRLWVEPRRPLVWRSMVHHCWLPLDVVAMNEAAVRLIGTHDFAAFAAAGHGRESTVRTIFDCHAEAHEPVDELDGRQIQIVVRGDGFLYRMVRIIAGTLVEVGRGKIGSGVIDAIIASGDRSKAGPTLPAEGLCLEWVRYEEGRMRPRPVEDGAERSGA